MKRGLMIVLLLLVIVGISQNVLGNNSKKENEDQAVQEGVSNLYEDMIDSFKEEDNVTKYPDNYGGSYIDDNGQFVIYRYNSDEEIAYAKGKNNVIYKQADYSYNELVDTMNLIKVYTENNQENELSKNVHTYGIYDDQNRIVVSMSDVSNEMVAQFKSKITSSEAVVFEQGEAPILY